MPEDVLAFRAEGDWGYSGLFGSCLMPLSVGAVPFPENRALERDSGDHESQGPSSRRKGSRTSGAHTMRSRKRAEVGLCTHPWFPKWMKYGGKDSPGSAHADFIRKTV